MSDFVPVCLGKLDSLKDRNIDSNNSQDTACGRDGLGFVSLTMLCGLPAAFDLGFFGHFDSLLPILVPGP